MMKLSLILSPRELTQIPQL